MGHKREVASCDGKNLKINENSDFWKRNIL